MPSLKILKNRIHSVKSTQKITKAMQLISASKLYKAREELKAAEPYVQELEQVTFNACAAYNSFSLTSINVTEKNPDYPCLVIVITSDRGLCGAFNAPIIKGAAHYFTTKKITKLICVGKKGYTSLVNQLKAENEDVMDSLHYSNKHRLTSEQRDNVVYVPSPKTRLLDIAMHIAAQLPMNTVSCYIIYNHFISALKYETIYKQLMPLLSNHSGKADNIYQFEPNSKIFAKQIIERNLISQIYYALLHHTASEHSARMIAMDHATNNSQNVIAKLSNQYHRTRQASITSELIEIISGAQAI